MPPLCCRSVVSSPRAGQGAGVDKEVSTAKRQVSNYYLF